VKLTTILLTASLLCFGVTLLTPETSAHTCIDPTLTDQCYENNPAYHCDQDGDDTPNADIIIHHVLLVC
jgi:hypothetical protein